MATEASNLAMDSYVQDTNFTAAFVISWTIPDPTYGQPPNGWYGVQSQYSANGSSWTDHYVVMSSASNPTTYTLHQDGMADHNDPSPRLLYWRLKTSFLYRGALYSNVIEVEVSNIVGSGSAPASNFRGTCQ